MGIIGIILLILAILFLFVGVFFMFLGSMRNETFGIVAGLIIFILGVGMLVASRMRLFAMRIFVR
jgi:hypothetical protein